MIPIAFCLSPSESNHSYDMLVEFALDALQVRGFDLVAHVTHTFSDAHKSCHRTLSAKFPEAVHTDCVQHAKKNIAKNAKKLSFKNKTALLQNDIDWTAFIRNESVFHHV